jgi:prepilin-type processing-associated H-X9-DG protein
LLDLLESDEPRERREAVRAPGVGQKLIRLAAHSRMSNILFCDV